jgi:hypothetical protein
MKPTVTPQQLKEYCDNLTIETDSNISEDEVQQTIQKLDNIYNGLASLNSKLQSGEAYK